MNTPEKKWYLMGNDDTCEIIHSETPPAMLYEGGKWTSRSYAHDSKEELIEAMGVLPEPCKICGRIVQTHYVPETKKKLTEKNLCFTCNYWEDRVELHKKPHSIVVDGVAYTAHKTMPGEPHQFRGFSGRKFRFRRIGSDEIEECANLWHQGPIPAHFRDRMPDNAEFVKSSE